MSEPTSRTEPIHQPALPPGTRMGEIEFHGVLGAGGFGIVYDATDLALGRRVAVKEYMPAFLAGRTSDGQITLLSQSNRTTFEAGLRSFIDEARLLAGLDHASLVKVFHFWKANGTAYFVMPFYDGHTLTHHRRHLHTRFGELRLRELLDGMLGALEVLHARKIVHRDVAPDNILLVEGTRPVLLDFGSARRTIEGQTATFTAVIKQGYAPIEQYDDTRSGIQGPWTDLYALGGTLYFLMTGRPPPPAQTRALTDDMPPLARQGVDGVSTEFLRIVDWMLQLRPQERPQSVRQVREALDSVDGDDKTISTMHVDVDVEPPPPADPLLEALGADRSRSVMSPGNPPAAAAAKARRPWMLIAVAALALIGAGAAGAWLRWGGGAPAPVPNSRAPAETPAAPASDAGRAAPPMTAAADEAASAAAADAASSPGAPIAPVTTQAAAAPASGAPGPLAAAAGPALAPAATAAARPAATAAAVAKAASAPAPAKTAATVQKPPADKAEPAADNSGRLSPDMAAALARAQAAQRAMGAGEGQPAPTIPSGMPGIPPSVPVVIESSEGSQPAASGGGGTPPLNSPLGRCRHEVGLTAKRICLETVCAQADFRFHAVCVRLHREGQERPQRRREP